MLNPDVLTLGLVMHEFTHYLLWVKEENFGYHNKRFRQMLSQVWFECGAAAYSRVRFLMNEN